MAKKSYLPDVRSSLDAVIATLSAQAAKETLAELAP